MMAIGRETHIAGIGSALAWIKASLVRKDIIMDVFKQLRTLSEFKPIFQWMASLMV